MYGVMVGLPFGRALSETDLAQVIDDFGEAAALAKDGGFDAVELHLGHGYLLSQFLSPASNRRRDGWGGTLERRLRLPLAVVEQVRQRVGPDYPIIAKMNLRDGFWGGLGIDEAVVIAQRLESAGVDAIEGSGGFTGRNPMFLFRGPSPLQEMIAVEHNKLQKWALRLFGSVIVRGSTFEELYFQADAKRVRAAVKIPVILLGGVVSRQGVETAMREGFDFVAMGRALIADPDFVNRLEKGELERSRCDACNKCIAEMEREGGVRCVLDDV
jgi:2,4-dienoyl-CoA reductase-like NADH-dependent reductase (Old Yellow Enzyme family)